MLIKSVHIKKFRAFNDVQINLAKKVTIISGQNGTLKTTLLGILGQPFSLENGALNGVKMLDGKEFGAHFKDCFKMSLDYDQVGEHNVELRLYNGIHPENTFEYNSIWRQRNKSLRIWSTKSGRQKGEGYIHAPVIYLSLNRLTPLGELKRFKKEAFKLTQEETNFFKLWHDKILSVSDEIRCVTGMSGEQKKSTLSLETDYYGSATISAGQDNIGKIILSVLSFKRLADNYPEKYKGGLLLIDELDCTLFPSAQKMIFDFLVKMAGKYKMQVVFTTHSMTILKETSKFQNTDDIRLLYLTKRDKQVTVIHDAALECVENDLKIEYTSQKTRLNLFAEDKVGINFAMALLCKYKDYIVFIKDLSLGVSQYKTLIDQCDIFQKAIVALDGDAQEMASYSNVLLLPTETRFPEDFVYQFLRTLPETDPFWGKTGAYTKQLCFKTLPFAEYNQLKPHQKKEIVKKWYSDNQGFWGNDCQELYKRWIQLNSEETQRIRSKFLEIYEKITGLRIRQDL